MIYALTIAFTFCFVMYQKYQQTDLVTFHRYDLRNTLWKSWANMMKVIFISGCYLMQLFPSTWEDYLLSGAIGALAFEFGINKIALKQGWFFNGASSKFDTLGKWKWIALFAFLIISIIVKIFL